MLFRDRSDAGRRLAEALADYGSPDTIVLALPRGGVVVGYEVATHLGAPLDVVIPRKIGAPGQPELAIGAIAGDGDVGVFDEWLIRQLGVSKQYLDAVIAKEREEMARRRKLYRGDRPEPDLKGRTVILVDDGIATGSTTLASIRAVRVQQPGRIVLAVPVAPRDTVERLKREVDDVVVLETPEPFYAVGTWYDVFEQTSDAEVMDLLASAAKPPEAS